MNIEASRRRNNMMKNTHGRNETSAYLAFLNGLQYIYCIVHIYNARTNVLQLEPMIENTTIEVRQCSTSTTKEHTYKTKKNTSYWVDVCVCVFICVIFFVLFFFLFCFVFINWIETITEARRRCRPPQWSSNDNQCAVARSQSSSKNIVSKSFASH